MGRDKRSWSDRRETHVGEGGHRETGKGFDAVRWASRRCTETGDAAVRALDGVSIDIERGRYTAIMGPSGSGKSTLMHCLAGLDSVTDGEVYIGDVGLSSLSDRGLTNLRRDKVGFIFQQFNLLPTLTAVENITLPLSIAGRRPDIEWLAEVVDTVGLGDWLTHRRASCQVASSSRLRAPGRSSRGPT
jgi:putative ABC transport system ATP-binding protein